MATLQIDDEGIPCLSGRQHWVLALLATYRSNAEIAESLCISINTVKKHISVLYAKLGVTNRSEAVSRGWRTFADAVRATSNRNDTQMRHRGEFAPDILALASLRRPHWFFRG